MRPLLSAGDSLIKNTTIVEMILLISCNPLPFLCPTIKGSSCLKMYDMQVQMLKNTQMSQRQEEFLVFWGTLACSLLTCGHRPSSAPTWYPWYPCGKGWHRAKSTGGNLFSPQHILSCFWHQSLKGERRLASNGWHHSRHPPVRFRQRCRGRRKAGGFQGKHSKGLRTNGLILNWTQQTVIPAVMLPYLRGQVKVSAWVSLASSDIGVFMWITKDCPVLPKGGKYFQDTSRLSWSQILLFPNFH